MYAMAELYRPASVTIGLDLAKWLARLTANATVATVHGFNHSILRHRRTRGAVDEAVLNFE
jgi:hypothetical protein